MKALLALLLLSTVALTACDDDNGGGSACEKSCDEGCCQGGQCIAFADQDDDSCGRSGKTCEPCDDPRGACVTQDNGLGQPGTCQRCTDDGAYCAACCTSSGECRSGNDNDACGIEGSECSDCTENTDSGRTVCINSSCREPQCEGPGGDPCDGCCTDPGNECIRKDAIGDAQCGLNSDECSDCAGEDKACDVERGYCIAALCRDDEGRPCTTCCDDEDKCVDQGTLDSACGKDGVRCDECDTANEQRCAGGECRGPCECSSFLQCCDERTRTCVYGWTDKNCGKDAAKCVDCTEENTTCDDVAQACNTPENCTKTCTDSCCTRDGVCYHDGDESGMTDDKACGLLDYCEDCTRRSDGKNWCLFGECSEMVI
jgi:hypothetical protein